MSTITDVKVFTWIEVRTKAKRVAPLMDGNVGDEITMVGGDWLGMGGVKMPAWSDGSPTHFKTIEEAKDAVKGYGHYGYGFAIIPNTIEFVRVTRKVETKEFQEIITE